MPSPVSRLISSRSIGLIIILTICFIQITCVIGQSITSTNDNAPLLTNIESDPLTRNDLILDEDDNNFTSRQVTAQATTNHTSSSNVRKLEVPSWFPGEQQTSVNNSTAAFTTSLTVNLVVGLILYLIFSLVRPWNVYYYAPRMIAKYVRAPRTITGQFYHWVIVTIRTPDRELLRNAGLDAYMFLRYLRLARKLFIIYCIIGLPTMMPLNVIKQGNLEGVREWTVANVTHPRRFWGHVICSYLFVGIALFYMVREMNVYTRLRHAYLTSPAYRKRPEATTMLITGLPAKIQFDQERQLQNIYDKVPGGLRSVLTVRRSVQVGMAKTRRDKLHQQLEKAICHYVATGVRPQVSRYGWPFKRHRTTPVEPSQSPIVDNSRTIVNESQVLAADELATTLDRSKSAPDTAFYTEKAQTLSKINEVTGAGITRKSDIYSSPESGESGGIPPNGQQHDTTQTGNDQLLDPSHDLIMNLALKLRQQERELEKVRNKANSQSTRFHIASTAFLRFRNQLGAQLAAQSVGFGAPLRGWPRFVGVRAEDVIWRNLRVLRWERWIRKGISFAASFLLTLFWAALVTLTSSVATLSSLSNVLPFLKPMLDLPKPILGVIEGIVPQAIIFFLMAFVPYILYFLSIFEGTPLYSRVYLTLMQRYFLFQLINILLVGTFAGTIFTTLSSLINQPTLTLTILAQAMPNSSTFFINYVVLLSLFGSAKELLRIPTLLVRWLRRPFTRFDTPRKVLQRRRLPEMEWGRIYPNAALIFCTGYVYSTIAPLILPFVVIYFTLHHIVFRYQFLYVYASHRGSAARAFPKAISHMFAGIYIQQLTLMGIMILHKQVALSIVQGLLFVFTLLAHVYMSKGFGMRGGGLVEYIPLETLANVEDQELQGLRSPEHETLNYDEDITSYYGPTNYAGQQSQISDTGQEQQQQQQQQVNGKETVIPPPPPPTSASNWIERGNVAGINLDLVSAMNHTTVMEVHDLINVFAESSRQRRYQQPVSHRSSLEVVTKDPSAKAAGKQPATGRLSTRRGLHKEELQEAAYELGELEASMDTNDRRVKPGTMTPAQIEEAVEMELIIEGELGEWDGMDQATIDEAIERVSDDSLSPLADHTVSIPDMMSSTEDTMAGVAARLEALRKNEPLHDGVVPLQTTTLTTTDSSPSGSLPSPSALAMALPSSSQFDEATTEIEPSSNFGLFPHAGTILVETTTISHANRSAAQQPTIVRSDSNGHIINMEQSAVNATSTQSYVVAVSGRDEGTRSPASRTPHRHGGAETPQRYVRQQQNYLPRRYSMEEERKGYDLGGGGGGGSSRQQLLLASHHQQQQQQQQRLSRSARQSLSIRVPGRDTLYPSALSTSMTSNGDMPDLSIHSPSIRRGGRHRTFTANTEGEYDEQSMDEQHWESDAGEEALRDQYTRPRFRRRPPVIWVPRDEAGLAEQECQRMLALGIPATCVDAELHKKGRKQHIAISRMDAPTTVPLPPPATTQPARVTESQPAIQTSSPLLSSHLKGQK